MSVTDERPLRADARRNRDAILAAAKAVLSKQGTDAQMDDIARKAKVGVGTVYRHFPTKEALIKALIADRQAQILANVREGLEDEDPWRGLCTSLRKGGELGAQDRALSEAFAEHMSNAAAPVELLEAADELVKKCQAAGALRADFRATDIPMFMCGLMQAMHKMSPDGKTPGPWQRHLQLILDGMRARPDLDPLPE